MARVSASFDQVNSDLTDMLNKLMGKLAGLQTSWVGSGGRAFEDVKIRYEADLKQLNQALADTAEAIRTSGVSYDSTDSAAASLITKSGGGGVSLPL
jgi:WXG100 family type VII secretion target